MGEQRGLAPLLTVDLAPVTVELNLRESGARFPCKWSSVLEIYNSRTTLAREINALIRKSYGGHVFTSEIPRSIKAAEISVENKSIYDHDRSGKAAVAYENLTREVLSLGKQVKRHRTDPVR